MELILKTYTEKLYPKIKAKLEYILKDTFGIIVFLFIVFESVIFMSIIKSNDASKLDIDFSINRLLYGRTLLYILFTLVLFSFTFLFSKKVRFRLLIIIKLLYSVLIVGDLWYYRGFYSFLSLHNLGETQNLGNLNGTVLAMLRPIDMIFVVENLIIITLAIILRKRYASNKKEKGLFLIFFVLPFTVLLSMHLAYDYKGSKYNGPVFFQTQFMPYSTMSNLTPIGYHFYDTITYIMDNIPYKLKSSDIKEISDWLANKNENLPANQYSGLFKGKNLIFIQVESLENFVIGQKYNGQTLTPNLNSLLKNSLYFSNFYDQVNTGNSADADLMVNASVLPVRRGSTFFRFPDNQYNTLSDLLGGENYYSRSLHASDGRIWNISQALENFGFNESWDIKDFKNDDVENMGLSDESFFKQVSALTDKDKKPFYYYTVTVSSHVPFVLPDNMKNLKLPKDFDETSMGAYLQAINYADKQIGSFIKDLDKKGILDNSVIVIMGDHCGVHKYYGDEVDSLSQKQSWWDNNGKVPFIIYEKGITGKNITTTGGQIDVLPTIASLMGLDKTKYENFTMGRNLLNTNKSYALLNDGTIVGEDKLSQEDISNIKKSFDISDLIIKTDYFKQSNISK